MISRSRCCFPLVPHDAFPQRYPGPCHEHEVGPDGQKLRRSYHYREDGRLAFSVRYDGAGVATVRNEYDYGPRGRLTEVVESDLRARFKRRRTWERLTFGYDVNGRLVDAAIDGRHFDRDAPEADGVVDARFEFHYEEGQLAYERTEIGLLATDCPRSCRYCVRIVRVVGGVCDGPDHSCPSGESARS